MRLFSALALVAAVLLCSAVLAGCTTTGTGYSAVPDRLLTCDAAPKSPAGNPAATDEDGALYVVGLAKAGQDCRSKLRSVREILKPEK
jgi:hypothetical protein